MTTPIDKLLQDVKKRLSKATPGPYSVHRFDNDGGDISYQIECESYEEDDQIVAWTGELTNLKKARNNAELIANAPTDLQKLVEIVEALRAALVDTKDGLQSVCEDVDHCFQNKCVPTKDEVSSVFVTLNIAEDAIKRADEIAAGGET